MAEASVKRCSRRSASCTSPATPSTGGSSIPLAAGACRFPIIHGSGSGTGSTCPHAGCRSLPEIGDDISSWFYDVEWELRSRFVPGAAPRRAASFARPAEIAARVLPRVDAVCAGYGLARTGGLLELLDDACREFAVAALTELGLSFSAGARWNFDSLESLAEQLGVLPRHARLLGRLTEMCAADGAAGARSLGVASRARTGRSQPKRAAGTLGE